MQRQGHLSAVQLRELVERTSPVSTSGERVLPVLGPLEPLFPGRGLPRGSVVEVSGGPGATSVAMALLAGASRTGSWAAVVELPELGWEAAGEHGVHLDRVVAVNAAEGGWPTVVAALVDAFDLVLCGPAVTPSNGELRRLRARARERGAVLLAIRGVGGRAGSWPAADLRLVVRRCRWEGLGQGWGHLGARRIELALEGRGSFSRPRVVELVLGAGGLLHDVHDVGAPAVLPVGEAPRFEQVG